MSTNPPGVVEEQVRATLRADEIRHELPLQVRRRRRRWARRAMSIARRYSRA